MALYAISDLHLSLNSDKPMDVFGELWKEHHIKVKENWESVIKEEDTVIIAGDISWALKFEDAMADLEFIHSLPGKKVMIKGNHDFWWGSITKMNALYDDMCFIQNTYERCGEYGICGTRGWVRIDESDDEAPHDEKVYKREIIRLKMSLDAAVKDGIDKLIVMMHYPPVTRISRSQEFLDLLSNYNVEKLIYGHIHFSSKEICINGVYNNIEYICTSADIINFNPIRIL